MSEHIENNIPFRGINFKEHIRGTSTVDQKMNHLFLANKIQRKKALLLVATLCPFNAPLKQYPS